MMEGSTAQLTPSIRLFSPVELVLAWDHSSPPLPNFSSALYVVTTAFILKSLGETALGTTGPALTCVLSPPVKLF